MDDGVRDGHGSFTSVQPESSGHWIFFVGNMSISDTHNLKPFTMTALERNAPWFATTAYSRHASLLMGELGILLVQMRVAPDQGLADEIYTLLASNSELPIVELMWGLPGCMLGCIHMRTMTNDDRFTELFQLQAARLLDDSRWTTTGQSGRRTYMGVDSGGSGRCMASRATCCRFSMAGIG